MNLNITVMNTIWEHSEGEHVFLPRALDGVWHEGKPHVPEIVLYPTLGMGEQYFTPLRFNGQRKRGLVGKPGVIFADVDEVSEKTRAGLLELPPSVIIKSSPGHAHVYWFLTQPVAPHLWEPHARGWTHEIGADPGGWDLTQVLRIPGTQNGKYDPSHTVYVQLFKPDRIYPLEAFPPLLVARSVAGNEPVPDQAKRDSYWNRSSVINVIPLSAQYWLSVSPLELTALGKIDRSKILWGLYKQLHAAGFTREEIFQLTYFSAVNKFKDHPGRLWAEIGKATLA
jgi:hypothetical protein